MNVTLSWGEKLVKAAKHAAVDEGKSLSGWLADLADRRIVQLQTFEADKKFALKMLDEGIEMNGPPLSREEIYRERLPDLK